MSFPKAKIKRFNEIAVSTPSPADYNVDFKQKPKLGIISQSGRFVEYRSPSASETASTQSTPCFKTPTIVRKKLLGSASKQIVVNDKLTDKDLLIERVVECRNKDIFIKELTEQLEELKTKVFNINCEKEKIDEKKKLFEEELCKLQKLHDAEGDNIFKKHEKELIELNDEILNLRNQVEQLNNENEILKSDLLNSQNQYEKEVNAYKKEIEDKEKLIEISIRNLKKMEEEKTHIEQIHKNELDNLHTKHKNDIQNIELEMLKCVHDVQNSLDDEKHQNKLKIKEIHKCFTKEIENLNQSFNNERQLLTSQHIAQIKQLEEKMNEIKVLSDILCKEKCTELESYWKHKMEKKEEESAAILKECQAISEYNIIESEVEKNNYKLKFETKIKKFNELERKYDAVYLNYKQLQASYSNAQNKLYRMIKELKDKERMKNEINKLLTEKQTYETTILRCQNTIEILKRRLTESDQDVEQLKTEIRENESRILEYEEQVYSYSTKLKEAEVLKEELEKKNDLILKTTQEEIKKITENLLQKVDDVKVTSEKHKKFYEAESQKKEMEKKELFTMLQDQQMLIEKSKVLIDTTDIELEKIAAENSNYRSKVSELTCLNSTLQTNIDILTEEKNNWKIEKKELELKFDILKNELDQLMKYGEALESTSNRLSQLDKINKTLEKDILEKNSEICNLKNDLEMSKTRNIELEMLNKQYCEKIEEQKVRIAPFKEQLESYELEMYNLKNAKNLMENEAKDLGSKFAAMLGHQNHKQKIKYMMGLKARNEDLLKMNLDLEGKTRIQEKKLEKLKKENIELKKNMRKISVFEDKENMPSPNRSIKCESPGPLKDLN
ncbi:hypothetical protein WA026_023602 [Henosepilachna vigintioctopunctata]|uniref:Hyaluronan-mediated motility receptor C-terminal domain-containing protein n=1 Tax=Henosepilachna vigintioctopunctata TaxID=420089 RepID=A0AAW1U825_9CUCU